MTTESAYALARQQYADLGVDTEAALRRLATVSISLHCWQGDDVAGFENPDGPLGGGIAATGNYPGKARTPDELRRDAAKALSLIPGKHRFNLHAFYGEFGNRRVDRDAIGPEMGKALGTPCVTNLWIPDGMKDTPADRVGPRERLKESLDAVFKEAID